MRGSAFMSARRLVHFDAHFANILTDGQLLYFADFGLALSADFDLSATERDFLSNHLTYDRYYTAGHLLRYHLLPELMGGADSEVASEIAEIIERHSRSTVILDEFHRQLLTESKSTRFPSDEIGATDPERRNEAVWPPVDGRRSVDRTLPRD